MIRQSKQSRRTHAHPCQANESAPPPLAGSLKAPMPVVFRTVRLRRLRRARSPAAAGRACALLGARAAQVLRAGCDLASRRQGAARDRLALRHRRRGPRLSPEQRRAARTDRGRVVVDGLRLYLDARLRQVRAKSKLAEAIRYALTRWDGLSRFLDGGRIDLDSNPVERSIRPLALNRKNALFAGSDEGGDNWAVIATLLECCKLNDVNPHAWLTALLSKLAASHPAKSRRRTHALDQRGMRTAVTINVQFCRSSNTIADRSRPVARQKPVRRPNIASPSRARGTDTRPSRVRLPPAVATAPLPASTRRRAGACCSTNRWKSKLTACSPFA